jgi:hypothetical protein
MTPPRANSLNQDFEHLLNRSANGKPEEVLILKIELYANLRQLCLIPVNLAVAA